MRIPMLLAAILMGLSTQAQADDRQAVLNVVDRFFAALAAHDTAAMAAIMTREGVFHAVRSDSPGSRALAMDHRSYLAQLAQDRSELLERYWDAVVMVNGPIATVTTSYDFHVDRKLGHCGTDVFTLIMDEGRWLISGGVYSMRRADCPESPLGPAY